MKKAKLDILEEIPELDIELSNAEEFPGQQDIVESEGATKFAFNKLLMVGIPASLLVISIFGLAIYFLINNIISGPEKRNAVKVAKETVRTGLIQQPGLSDVKRPQTYPVSEQSTYYLRDFIIDLKDSGGNKHVLMFDVALDMKGEQKSKFTENSFALRNAIYKVAQSRSPVALRSAEERKRLKKEIGEALEKVLGEGAVKNVFFTNYLMM